MVARASRPRSSPEPFSSTSTRAPRAAPTRSASTLSQARLEVTARAEVHHLDGDVEGHAAIIGSRCASPSSPSTTRAPHDPVLGVWAHRQALAARRGGRRRARARPAPAVPSRAALRARDPRALLAPLRQPLRARARRPPGQLRPVPRPAAPAQLRALGRLGGAAARARAAAAAAALPVRPRARALRRAGRRRRPPRRRRRARWRLRPRRRPAGGRRAVGRARRAVRGALGARRGSCSPTRRAWSGARGARRRATRASCTSAATCRRAGRRAGPARHRRPPGRPQAPRRRPARAVAAARPPARVDGSSSATGPSASRWSGSPRELGLSRPRALHRRAAAATRAEEARRGAVFVLPSVDEAFGVAYVEAMAGASRRSAAAARTARRRSRRPAAACGSCRPATRRRSPRARRAARRPDWRHELGDAARATVAAFTWEACGARDRRRRTRRRCARERHGHRRLPVLDGGPLLGEVLAAVRAQEVAGGWSCS